MLLLKLILSFNINNICNIILILIIINIGIILFKEVISLNWIISSIIITNKNKIAIAPTYIIIIIKGIKSKPKEIKNPEEFKNKKTNQNIEWIGLKDIIHIIVE